MLDSIFFKIAALCTVATLNTPLQVMKIRLQTNSQLLQLGRISHQYQSIRNCFRTMLQNEGIFSFWKGNTVTMLRLLPIQSINYYTRKTLQQYFTNTFINNILISIISGITASTILYPSDILRQFLNNNTKQQLSILTALNKMKQQYGFKYFYKGYPNILLTTSVYRSCYNGSYDTHKVYAKNFRDRALIAYISTVVAQCIVYPIQIVRRRRIIMNAKEGFIRYGLNIWQTEGITGFFKGAKLIPFQSVTWGIALIIFDTAGIDFESSLQG